LRRSIAPPVFTVTRPPTKLVVSVVVLDAPTALRIPPLFTATAVFPSEPPAFNESVPLAIVVGPVYALAALVRMSVPPPTESAVSPAPLLISPA
jgi:hypothetical protein